MTSPVTVSERDLRALLGIVGDHRSDLPPAGLPPSLLTDLRDQIRCDELQFLGQDTLRQTGWFAQCLAAGSDIPGDDADDQQLYWELYWDSICATQIRLALITTRPPSHINADRLNCARL